MRHKRAKPELDPQYLSPFRPGDDPSRRQWTGDQRQHATFRFDKNHMPLAGGGSDRRACTEHTTARNRFDIRRLGGPFDVVNAHAAISPGLKEVSNPSSKN